MPHQPLSFFERILDILRRNDAHTAASRFTDAIVRLSRTDDDIGDLLQELRSGAAGVSSQMIADIVAPAPLERTHAVLSDCDRIAEAYRAAAPFARSRSRRLEGRLFEPFIFENGWTISAQGDRAGYACEPRERLHLQEQYRALEVIVYAPDRDVVDPKDLGLSDALIAKFSSSGADDLAIGARLDWADIAELTAAVRIAPRLRARHETEIEP